MKRRIVSYIILLSTLVALFAGLAPAASASDDGYSLTDEQLYSLMEKETLHPQKTGYPEMDRVLEEIMAPYEGMDAVQKLKAIHEYVIRHITYSWNPYPYHSRNAADTFAVDHHLAYNYDLEEVIPYSVVNRAYHALTVGEGVCYDFAAAFTVLARYIGFNSYFHYGDTDFTPHKPGEWFNKNNDIWCPHGWSEIWIGGEKFIVDPETDYVMSGGKHGMETFPVTGPVSCYNFCVTNEGAWRFVPYGKCLVHDKEYKPVEQHRNFKVRINIEASPSGSAELWGGEFWDYEKITLHAGDEPGFYGWYGPDGSICSATRTCSPALYSSGIYKAVFNQEYFDDVEGCWYEPAAKWGWNKCLINGSAPFIFNGDGKMTRAMAAQTIYRFSGDRKPVTGTKFSDVPSGAWYSRAVAWCAANQVVNGMSETEFCPDDFVTREDFITMLMRFADLKGGYDVELGELEYTDSSDISDYAQEHMKRAQALGLIGGYEDGSIRPGERISRAECITMIQRLDEFQPGK